MKYFTIRELTASSTANRLGIDNTPNAAVQRNLTRLVENLLDPIRTAWGKPLTVTSGYRCKQLNKAVGGVSNSQHVAGLAADLVTQGNSHADNLRLYNLIRDRFKNYDQVIAEKVSGGGCEWVHVSIAASGKTPRRQALTVKK